MAQGQLYFKKETRMIFFNFVKTWAIDNVTVQNCDYVSTITRSGCCYWIWLSLLGRAHNFSINLRCFVASSSKEMGCLNYLFRDMSKTVLYSKGVLILTKMGLCKIWHRSGYRSQLLLVFWVTFQQGVEIIKISPWDIQL